jgi:Na+-driven multidrug efflux pump
VCALVVLVLGAPTLPVVWASLPVAVGLGLAASVAWLRSGRWRRAEV